MLQGVVFNSRRHPCRTPLEIRRLRTQTPSSSKLRHATGVSSATQLLPKQPVESLEGEPSNKTLRRFVEQLLHQNPPSYLCESIRDSGYYLYYTDPGTLIKLVFTFARSPNDARCSPIFDLANELGCTLGHSVYEAICGYAWHKRHWDRILAITESAKKHHGNLTTKLLNWRATALMETKEYGLLGGIFQEFRDSRCYPDQSTYHIVMTGCIRNYDLEGFKIAFHEMKAANFSPNEETCTIISKSYWQFGADSDVRKNAIDNIPKLSRPKRMLVFNNLLHFSLSQGDTATISRLLSMLDTPNINFLTSFLSSDQYTPASSEQSQLDTILVQPDSDTYAIFMNHLNQEGRPSEAISLWETAAEKHLYSTDNVIAALIYSCFLLDRGDTALQTVAALSVKSRRITCGNALQRLMESTNVEGPLKVNRPSGTLTIRLCNVLLKSLLRRQGLSSVIPMFIIMQANELEPNERTLETILSYLNQYEEPRPRTLFRLARNFSSLINVSPRHMHHVISRILRNEKKLFIDSAWRLSAKNSRPIRERRKRVYYMQDSENFDPLGGLGFGYKLSYRTLAQPILESLTKRDFKLDPAIASQRMRRDAVINLDIDSAINVFRAMLARGLRPTAYHYTALMEGYALSGDVSSAYQMMEAAKKIGVKPNLVMYNILIAAYAKHRDSSSAMKVFNQLISAGLRPDSASIDALTSAFYASDGEDAARQVLTRVWFWVAPFPQELHNASLNTLVDHFRALDPKSLPREVLVQKPRRTSLYQEIGKIVQMYKKYFTQNQREKMVP